MSYILNALRKAEKERQQKQEQNLGVQLLDAKAAKSRSLMPWLLLLLAVNAGVLAYVMMREEGQTEETQRSTVESIVMQTPEPVASTVAKASSAPEPAQPIATIPDQKKQTVNIVAGHASNRFSAVSESKPKFGDSIETTATAETQQNMMSEDTFEFDKERPLVAAASEAQALKSTTRSDKESAVNAEMARRRESETLNHASPSVGDKSSNKIARTQENKNKLPWLHELPAAFRRQVPDLEINVYVYNERPENRFIMVAMKKFKVGQELSSGMVLQEIQSDGIVVQFQGKRFKIKRA